MYIFVESLCCKPKANIYVNYASTKKLKIINKLKKKKKVRVWWSQTAPGLGEGAQFICLTHFRMIE